MAELRFNPLLGTYTMVASNRQNRPTLPKDFCPFCPGSGRVPEVYDVLAYANDFPALSRTPEEPEIVGTELYPVEPSYGVCEVLLFSPDHRASLATLTAAHIEKVVALWQERFALYAADSKIKYVFEFENKGEEVGVTMPHPHGQLYGYPFVPQKIAVELANTRAWYKKHCIDMLGAMNAEEEADGRRILFATPLWLCYLPSFTDYPYGTFLVPRRHFSFLTEATGEEARGLAEALSWLTAGFDALFQREFPYMMCLHAAPVNSPEWEDGNLHYRFHIEFYPPLRDGKRIKYYAGSEMGAWAAANTRAVEETASELRSAIARVKPEAMHYQPR
jgi:UDPglucose--hexose-1-phosphate uridylyltransferase